MVAAIHAICFFGIVMNSIIDFCCNCRFLFFGCGVVMNSIMSTCCNYLFCFCGYGIVMNSIMSTCCNHIHSFCFCNGVVMKSIMSTYCTYRPHHVHHVHMLRLQSCLSLLLVCWFWCVHSMSQFGSNQLACLT